MNCFWVFKRSAFDTADIPSSLKHFLHLLLGILPYPWPLPAPLSVPLPFPNLRVKCLSLSPGTSAGSAHLMALSTTDALMLPECVCLAWISALNSQLICSLTSLRNVKASQTLHFYSQIHDLSPPPPYYHSWQLNSLKSSPSQEIVALPSSCSAQKS